MEALQTAATVRPRRTKTLADTGRHKAGNKAVGAGLAQDSHMLGQGAGSKVQGRGQGPQQGTCNGAAIQHGGRQGLVERPGEKPRKKPSSQKR